jgi:hypothetical protein
MSAARARRIRQGSGTGVRSYVRTRAYHTPMKAVHWATVRELISGAGTR